ncbi:MAG TPA: 4Fe-4S binding protein [Prolixibacteraceae bacterium]|nr:4Fe-4S binding protein [Prolixibacteraceae bacterium]
MNKTAILLCQCRDVSQNQFHNESTRQILSGFDADVYVLDDLCALVCNEKSFFETIQTKYSIKMVLACYSRVVENLFLQNKIPFSFSNVISYHEIKCEDQLAQKLAESGIASGNARFSTVKSLLGVPSWYPVIDRSRCTNCGKCARFCLFGVYSFNNQKLDVVNPLSCKNLCPACARTCPSSSIMFPKLAEGGVLAGAVPGEIRQPVVPGEGNLTSRLSQRNQLHQSVLKRGFLKQAEEERRKALDELKTKMQQNDQSN